MRIAVFGAGGVGGYFGARLAEAGHEVAVVARGRHLEAIRSSGLALDSIAGDAHLTDVRASDDPAEIGPVDVVLVAVKAWQVPEVAGALGPLLGPETFVVPLQNGLDAPDHLAAEIGRERVLGGLCGLIAYIAEPGRIAHVGAEPFVRFGELDGARSGRVDALLEAFAACRGVHATAPDDIVAAMWRKFLLIASWGGVGAVTRAPIGVIRSVPESRALLRDAMHEIVAVAEGAGVGLPASAVEASFGFLDALPHGNTASMQRDVMDGRRSELDEHNGAVVRIGREVGVPTPVHGAIYGAVRPQELKARGRFEGEGRTAVDGA